jgi:GcrA cell cycle regulator
MSWTDDRVSLLRRLWGEGRTAAEIAKELGGVTRNAVIGKAHRLKLSNRVSPIQQNKKPASKPVHERKISSDQSSASVVVSVMKSAPVRLKPEIKTGHLLSLMDLKPRQCRWPVGDPHEEAFGFCGCESISGLPYCSDHAKVAYQAATRNRILQAAKQVSA